MFIPDKAVLPDPVQYKASCFIVASHLVEDVQNEVVSPNVNIIIVYILSMVKQIYQWWKPLLELHTLIALVTTLYVLHEV